MLYSAGTRTNNPSSRSPEPPDMLPAMQTILGESWTFLRKQPAVLPVILWFQFLPMLFLAQIPRMEQSLPYFSAQTTESSIVLLLLTITFNLIIIWGSVCVLLIAKRLLQAKAGRTRTSLRAVCAQSASFFLPYLLTSILRAIIALLWGFLFLIPIVIILWFSAPSLLKTPSAVTLTAALPWLLILLFPTLATIASLVRTAFYPILVLNEDIAYRPALRKSSALVRSRFWEVFFSIALLTLFLFIPAELISVIAQEMANDAPYAIALAADIIGTLCVALASALYLLGITLLYRYFRPVSYTSN